MFINRQIVTVTTAADGSATAYTSEMVNGRISAIQYVKPASGGFSDGSTFLLTTEETAQTIWGEAAVNASTVRLPRLATHTTAGAAATYDGTRAVLDYLCVDNERIKIVITSGGALAVGVFHITLC